MRQLRQFVSLAHGQDTQKTSHKRAQAKKLSHSTLLHTQLSHTIYSLTQSTLSRDTLYVRQTAQNIRKSKALYRDRHLRQLVSLSDSTHAALFLLLLAAEHRILLRACLRQGVCVCVFTYICMYTYISMYTCIYMYIYAYIYK